ncbi:MAG TPA: YigZ family protein [Aliicoccus persicus]|uniref:YigZ family protein n=1 Tax=Aliicoccus persicus TaxID=930138 RepID=A0A921DYM4_9STAP|nr:YigZ family protein [Aliicoccus persicus]
MEQTYMNYKNTSSVITINKSNFIGHIARTESEDEAKAFVATIKEKYKDATHNCSAYIIGESALIQRADDDGEPSGTAGVPMLEVLKREDLYNTTVVVTRYFGGVKLGAGGLIRAYAKSTSEVVKAAGKVYLVMMHPVTLVVDYTFTNSIEHYFENNDIQIKDTAYTDKVTYHFYVETDKKDTLQQQIQAITKDNYNMRVKEEVPSERVL